ncbi:hypothetical protein DICPUDRAFT_160380 [Dictyostelium purpureum]|uniref:F-box domain-containing protein n=1 Tax=Dictyostelium purpureum TaxID=5786 RepID=F1A686_DICPU|nr:uncharacterized protein DICPUDRAFT_160380 [Dictyostelium purpureum]EGC28294.1 hypothetical protein DICPUDRAFT_160380 [Dictyostelium purpureum]|eukprot:XP_003295180.1 hypothetical protein DICPUDRAFT_160380 [Dictyostelium purpureum]
MKSLNDILDNTIVEPFNNSSNINNNNSIDNSYNKIDYNNLSNNNNDFKPSFNIYDGCLKLPNDLKDPNQLENNSFIGTTFNQDELDKLLEIYLEGLGLLERFESELNSDEWKFVSKEESEISIWSKPYVNPEYPNATTIGSSLLSRNQIIDVNPDVAALDVSDWLARFKWDRYLDRFEIVYYFTTNDKQKAQKLNIPYSKYDILLLHMYTNMSLFIKSRDCVILQISGQHPIRKGSYFTISRDYNEFIGCPKSKDFIRGGMPIFGYIFEPFTSIDENGNQINSCFSNHICSFDFGEGKSITDYILTPLAPKISLMNLLYKIKFIRNKLQNQKTMENYKRNQSNYIPNISRKLQQQPSLDVNFRQQKTREEWMGFFKDLDEKAQWNSLPSKLSNICVYYDRSSKSPILIKTKYQVSIDPKNLAGFLFEEDFQWDPFIYHMTLQDKITTLKGGGPVISSKFKYDIPFYSIKCNLQNGYNTAGYFLLEQRENGDIFMFIFNNLKFKSDECQFTTYFYINPDNWRDKLNPADLESLKSNQVPQRSLDILMLIKSSFSSSSPTKDSYEDPTILKIIYLFTDIIDNIYSKFSKETQVLDSIKFLTISESIEKDIFNKQLPKINDDQIIIDNNNNNNNLNNNLNNSSISIGSSDDLVEFVSRSRSSSSSTVTTISKPNSPISSYPSSPLDYSLSSPSSPPQDEQIENYNFKNKRVQNQDIINDLENNLKSKKKRNSVTLETQKQQEEEKKEENFKQFKQFKNFLPIPKSSPKNLLFSPLISSSYINNSILLPPFIPSINSDSSKFFYNNYKKQTEGDHMENTNLFCLPHEIIITVLSHLDHRALCKVSRTCKYMKTMAESDILWYRLYVNIFGEPSNTNINNNKNCNLKNLWDSYVKTEFQFYSPTDINFDNPSLTFFLSKETNYETIVQQWKKNFFLKIRMEVLWQISKIYNTQPLNNGPNININNNNSLNNNNLNNNNNNNNNNRQKLNSTNKSRISLMSIASYRISPSQFALIPNASEGTITSTFLDGDRCYSGYSTGETYMIDFSNIKTSKPLKINYIPQESAKSIHLWKQLGTSLVYSGLSNNKLIRYNLREMSTTREISIVNPKIPNDRWKISGMSSNYEGSHVVVHYDSNEEQSEFEDYDTVMDLFDANTGAHCLSITQDDQITATHSHTNRVAVGCSNGPVNLYDINTGKKVISFLGHTDEIYSVRVLSKEDIVIASSKDGTVRFFDERTGPFYIKRIVDNVKSFDVEPKKILCGGGSRISYWDPRNLNVCCGELWSRPDSEIKKVQLSQFNVTALFEHGSTNIWKFNV